jgi:hypothetical protein
MTAVKTLWGPGGIGWINAKTAALSTTALNDADNAVGWIFNIPKDGTITDVGFLITATGGTPPAYNVGIVTQDSAGRPTTTAYGGSAVTSYTPTSTGWKWVTLSTGATAQAGDYAAVHIYPSASAPNGTNNITVCREEIASIGGIPVYYSTAWVSGGAGTGPFAIKYSDGSIHGLALSSNTVHVQIRSNTDPDEVGCKFTVPAAMTCYGARLHTSTTWGSAAAANVVLYSAADATVASAAIGDKDNVDDSSYIDVFWDAVSLSAATTYRLTVQPTVASNGDIYAPKWSFESTTAVAALPCGDAWQWTQRTDAGAWTDTNTAIAPMALWVSDITFSTTTAGGGAYAYIG